MKYIRKFNENVDEHFRVYNLLKDIFAELIDDTSIQVKINLERMNKIYVDIKPWTDKQPVATEMTTEEMINIYQKYLELVKDIEVCYKRANDELPDVKSELMVAVDNRIYIYFNLPSEIKSIGITDGSGSMEDILGIPRWVDNRNT